MSEANRMITFILQTGNGLEEAEGLTLVHTPTYQVAKPRLAETMSMSGQLLRQRLPPTLRKSGCLLQQEVQQSPSPIPAPAHEARALGREAPIK